MMTHLGTAGIVVVEAAMVTASSSVDFFTVGDSLESHHNWRLHI